MSFALVFTCLRVVTMSDHRSYETAAVRCLRSMEIYSLYIHYTVDISSVLQLHHEILDIIGVDSQGELASFID